MKLRASVLVLLTLSITFNSANANALSLAGTSCVKVGATKTVDGVKYSCVRSGKKLVWNKSAILKTTPAPTAKSSATASPTPTASPTVSNSGLTKLTSDEVAKHATSSSCWSIVSSNVYDLTNWISRHPGGAVVIKAICGKDGTDAFEGQHANQGKPARELSSFLIGKLGESVKL